MMNLIIVESNQEFMNQESLWQLNQKCNTFCSIYRQVRWLRTLVSSDRKRTISELEAPDAESVRELLRQQEIAFERVWTATERKHYS